VNKEYRPAEIEGRHYARWEAAGYFAPAGNGAPYCIVIPPPNVTGTLHMGHALQDTIMDALTRYHRMQARRTLWQPGTDHAGIATQMVDERLLHPVKELLRVGGERLDVDPLTLRGEHVEGERRLSRSGRPGHYRDGAAGQIEIAVLEVVLPGAADPDGIIHNPGQTRSGERSSGGCSVWGARMFGAHGPAPRRPEPSTRTALTPGLALGY